MRDRFRAVIDEQSTGRCTIRVRKKLFREPPPKPEHRINDRIRVSPVRLINEDGQQVGVVPVEEARAIARDHEQDLVEIAPNVRPPVCRVMDYQRWKFEQDKKAKSAKKQQHQIDIKEVKFRPNISDHDFLTKVRNARKFLEKGQHVKLTVMFRRREMRRPENGYELLHRAVAELDGVAVTEREPPSKMEGRDLTMVVKPAPEQ
jgi:translation initiation factor IF-3